MKKKKEERKKKESKPGSFYRFLSIVLIVVSIIALVMTNSLGILPLKFMLPLTIILILVDVVLIKFLLVRNHLRIVSSIISIILIIVLCYVIIHEITTLNFFSKIGGMHYKIVNYEVVVLNDSSYDKLDDLKKEEIGLLNTTEKDYKEAIKELEKKIKFDNKSFNDNDALRDNLIEGEIAAILIEESTNNILKEEDEEYKEKTKVIYSFEVKIEVEDISKKVDITKNPFSIYITGIDTYGSISTASRSDVNIVVTVNPKTKKVMLTSIPRDYYVKLHSKKEHDKLTHAGIYGVEESVTTIEDLLNIDINYYVKVNFTSLIDIVDSINGITVNSNYDFKTGVYDSNTRPYSFKKGKNELNGKEALAFSRERKAFNGGDRVRNENQQLVLKAIADKVLSPTILTKYNSLLSSLEGAFVTNLDDSEITSFIKKQLDENSDWDISNYVLEGTDSSDYTYSYKSGKSYVMLPDLDSVNSAIDKINEVLNNE